MIPAKELRASVNDFSADVLVFAKPMPAEVELAKKAKARGAKVIVDVCDDHIAVNHYQAMIDLADVVTCPTKEMARLLQGAEVIEDPYEYEECAPHMRMDRLMWFGHPSNLKTIRGRDFGRPVRVISSGPGVVQWSPEIMRAEFAEADIVVLPASASYKSPNRAVESIRQGCFAVAEPHPSLEGFPIYKGDIKEGIEWAIKNPQLANQMTREAQWFVSQRFSPKTQANAWKKILGLDSTLDAANAFGRTGSTLTASMGT
jgi:hypothetical protein